MKISLNWIRKYVDLPEDLSEKQIAYDLTMRTVEVEDLIDTSLRYHNIVVGKIINVNQHPNADKLKVCTVDCGLDELKEIVCGGLNLYEGQYVAVALPGSSVVWHGEGEPVKIKESKLRAVKSYGMISASEEIYLGDIYKDEPENIMDLGKIEDIKQDDLVAGASISDILNLNDFILDIDNKSLTNRPDLWGHYGVAREIAAIYKLKLKDLLDEQIKIQDYKSLPKYKISILEKEKCKRYLALKIENLYVKESPAWLKIALKSVGINPKNAIVDITNYVMLATGQPNHAFDSNQVEGEEIVVRNATNGEKIVLLDDNDLELSTDDLVIADIEEPMCLAGIRGGKKDSVLDSTESIVLEIANFSPNTIRKTEQRFGEKTDSGIRFEKGIDTERIDIALDLSLDLFNKIYPENKITAYGEVTNEHTASSEIDISQDFLDRRIGTKLSEKDIIDTLSILGYQIEVRDKGAYKIDKSIRKDSNGNPIEDKYYHILAPTWRSTGDVSIRDDILGDLARMIGYENFKRKPLPVEFNKAIKQPKEELERRIREYLSFRCNFYEIFTYPWVSDKYINAINSDIEKMVKLATPPSPEQAYLRSTLITGLLESAEKNLRYFNEFNLYEIAEVFEKGKYSPSTDEEILPVQKMMISGISVSNSNEKAFFDIKGVLESMSRYCHMEDFTFKKIDKPSWADENAYLNILSSENIIGSFGLVSLKSLHESGINNPAIAVFEIEMSKLKPFASRTNEYISLPVFPQVEEDLSIVVDEQIKWKDIYSAIINKCNEVKFKEVYRGKQIPEGKKSIMFTVSIGSDKGTLNSKQIEKKMRSIIETLKKLCGAELRS